MNKLYDENSIMEIASAIRSKSGTSDTFKVSEMANAIQNIPTGGGGITPTGTKDIVVNGRYDITTFAEVNVDVPSSGIVPTGTQSIVANGIYDITNFASVNVNVPTGGGLPDNMVIGEFTPDTDEETHTVTYSKDKTPIMAICFVKEKPVATPYLHIASVGLLVGDSPISAVAYTAGNGSMPTTWSASYSGVNEMTSTSTTFKTRASNYLMKSGFTYTYIIVF